MPKFSPPSSRSKPPSWQPLADLLIQRLRLAEDPLPDDLVDGFAIETEDLALELTGLEGDKPSPEISGSKTKTRSLLADLDAALLAHEGAKAAAETTAGAIAPAAGDDTQRPAPQTLRKPLPPRDLILTLRLAASFPSRAAFEAAFAHGAFTVITGIAREDLSNLVSLLSIPLCPPGWVVSQSSYALAPRQAILLAPGSSDGGVSDQAMRKFWHKVEDQLDAPMPVIVLVPADQRLPEPLQAALPRPIRLAPLSQEILLRLLAETHGPLSAKARTRLAQSLPDNACLASLSPPVLRLALRAPKAEATVDSLHRLIPAKSTQPQLDQMTGSSPALSAARMLVSDLAAWQAGRLAWSKMTRSLLLYGPPGTGKTWLARAIGGTAGIRFVEGSFAAWHAAGHLGEMLAAMRKTFAEAIDAAPAVLFIDEVDSAGSRFTAETSNRSYRTQVINGFLQEIDAAMRAEGVILIGACNRPETLDPAILRPGRFDAHVELPLPDATSIDGLLRRAFPEEAAEGKHHGTDTRAPQDARFRACAHALLGHSPAEIDARIRQGHSLARQLGTCFNLATLHQALLAEAAPDASFTHRVALHECGHAITAKALGLGPVSRILLMPDGGEVWCRRTRSHGLLRDWQADLVMQMAGRAAERLVLGAASSGAGGSAASDLAMATRLALDIDLTLGLGIHGAVWRGPADPARLSEPADISRIRARLDHAEREAMAILTANRPVLEAMAVALAEQRELQGDDLEGWLAKVRPTHCAPSRAARPVDRCQSDPVPRTSGSDA